MSISANKLMSGATALSFKDLAEIQKYMAEMEIDNYKMYTGTDGKAGFFSVEASSNQAAVDFANQEASKEMLQGWIQCADSMTQAAGQLGGIVMGNIMSRSETADAEELNSELYPPKTAKVVTEPVAKPAETPAQEASVAGKTVAGEPGQTQEDVKKATIIAKNEAQAKEDQTAQATKNAEAKEADDKRKAKIQEMEGHRTQASNIKSQWQNYFQLVNNVSAGAFKAGNGFIQQSITQAKGRAVFMQGIQQSFGQVTQMTNSAIEAERSQEQAAAGAFTSIIQLTGAARG